MSSRNYSYCSADDDVRILLKKVTDAITTDVDIEYYIARTDDYIDARLFQLYTVPFTTTPPIVRTISTHITAYYVLRMLYVQARTTDNDAWMRTFKDFAYDLLKEIDRGDIVLLDSSGNKLPRKSSRGIKSSTEEYTPTFNEGEPLTWEKDPKK